MGNELTKKEINELCMFLRVIDHFEKYKDVIKDNIKMKLDVSIAKKKVAEIMDYLTEEQRDMILEIHKQQAEMIARKAAAAKQSTNSTPPKKKRKKH